MLRKILTVATLLAILTSCSGGRKLSEIRSEPVSGFSSTEGYTAIYNLPAASFVFNIEATRSVIKRGPYFQYAEKYLGISGVPAADSESWAITGVLMEQKLEADPGTYYVLSAAGRPSSFLQLVSQGFIIPITHSRITPSEKRFTGKQDDSGKILFTDLSVKRNIIQETQSSTRLMQQDTAFVSVPVLRKEVVRKTLEEKAKEAADFIIDLRMNRFKLISGEYDLFPDGEAMKAILGEYKRLEDEYLALFIGKNFKQVHTVSFEYIPSGKDHLEQTILFRFSDRQGVVSSENLTGQPVLLEIEKENKTASLARLAMPEQSDSKNRIFYRVPDAVSLRLLYDNIEIYATRTSLPQAGKIISVPHDFYWD